MQVWRSLVVGTDAKFFFFAVFPFSFSHFRACHSLLKKEFAQTSKLNLTALQASASLGAVTLLTCNRSREGSNQGAQGEDGSL